MPRASKDEPKKDRYVALWMSQGEYKLLRDIMKMSGLTNMSEAIRHMILVVHILLKAGLWKLIKRVPERAKLVVKEVGCSEEEE